MYFKGQIIFLTFDSKVKINIKNITACVSSINLILIKSNTFDLKVILLNQKLKIEYKS